MSLVKLSPAASISTTPSGVILNSDLGTFRLKGADLSVFVDNMIPKLNGTASREDIARSTDGYNEASVLQFLSLLDERGLLEPASEDTQDMHTEFGPQERFAKDLATDFLPGLREAKVLIAGLEPWGASVALELAATGVGTLVLMDDRDVTQDDLLSVRGWNRTHVGENRALAMADLLQSHATGCRVIVTPLEHGADGALALDDQQIDLIVTGLNADDHHLLLAVAKLAQARAIPSLNGHLDGHEAWVGPALVPGQSGCWNCYRLRKLGTADNPQASHELEESRLSTRQAPRARALLAPMAPTLGNMMTMDALRLLGLDDGLQAGSFRVQNLVNGKVNDHNFVPMPWCEVCGGAEKATAEIEEPAAKPADQAFPLDMVRNGEDLRKLMGGWVDKEAGVIRDLMLTPTGTMPTLPRTASANLVGFTSGEIARAAAPMIGSGKSVSDLGAEIGALGEAIERYSASRFHKEDMVYARRDALNAAALDPANFALYSKAQYESQHFPCTPWDPDQEIHWVKGRMIGADTPVWVPALPTFFNFMAPHKERFCAVSSNGLAAGGDLRDASVRAAFELLERDAFMLNWLARRPAQQIVMDESLDPQMQGVLDQVKAQGAEVEFWRLDDLGTGIPTVVCLGLGDGKSWGGTTLGLSCHANLRDAMNKALLELAHFGPYLVRLMQSEKIPQKPEEVRTLEDHALYYAPRDKRPAFDFMRDQSRDPIHYSATAEMGPAPDVDLYDHLAKGLGTAKIALAAVDVTSPDVKLSPFRVARALGEFVQPIHFGYHMRPLANQRLDDLLAGAGVNPDPHPIA